MGKMHSQKPGDGAKEMKFIHERMAKNLKYLGEGKNKIYYGLLGFFINWVYGYFKLRD